MILGAMTISAAATSLKPGDILKYQYTMTMSTPGALPNGGQVASHPRSFSYPFTVSADRVDDEGIVHAIIKTYLKVYVRGWSLNEPFEGSVMPDGEIVPKYDLVMLKGSGIDQNNSRVTPGYHPRTHDESVAFAAAGFNLRLGYFNELALGAGKKAPFKEGDTWRVTIADKDEILDFTYQGMQSYQGHEVAAIGFTTTRMTQNGVVPVTGNVLYDVNRHIVTSVHWAGDDDSQAFGEVGVSNVTVDIALQ